MKSLLALVATLLLALVAGACGERVRESAPFHDALQQRLASPPPYAQRDAAAWSAVKVAYRKNDDALLWLGEGAPRVQLSRLRAAIADAVADGLDPAEYDLRAVDTLVPSKIGLFAKRYEPTAAASTDVQVTFVAVRLARDLQRGRVAPTTVDAHWRDDAHTDFGALIQAAAGSGDVAAALRALAPRDPQYARLRQALLRYRQIAMHGGWPKVAPLSRAKPGAVAAELPAVRARLIASGHLSSDDPARAALDPELQGAIKRFQHEHGLDENGKPDAATVAAMNVPVEDRIAQIQLNLERWRWLGDELADPRVVVNVPTFQLMVVDGGAPVLQMRVVAGKVDSPTPIFSATMQTLVFSPYWNVPASILKDEVIPELDKDPDYLARKNMEVVRAGVPVDEGEDLSFEDDPTLRVRQKPGAGNALGHVKFLFPNEFDVYLHDTPLDTLFVRRARGFSHGCVRIEKPFELAQWVLKDRPEWTPEKIDAAMNSGTERHVALKRKVPVYILYRTVWVDDDGSVRFANDLYGHDKRQLRLLASR